LENVPKVVRRFDYLREDVLPGDQVKAIDQCIKAFGSDFKPHVKKNEEPFDVRCFEIKLPYYLIFKILIHLFKILFKTFK